MNEQVTHYINEASADQKQIMGQLRQLIHENVPGVTEEFKWSRPVFRSTKDFAYFKTSKAHLTLGFTSFANLDDKDNLLEGTGKDMRHIKIKKPSDINAQLLAGWFKAAAQ
jgi:hypothetical protein